MIGRFLFLAHQGGWDELLIYGIPVIGVLLFVRWAERRARQRRRVPSSGAEGGPTSMPGRDDVPEGPS